MSDYNRLAVELYDADLLDWSDLAPADRLYLEQREAAYDRHIEAQIAAAGY